MTCARHVQATMKVKAQKVIYRIKHTALVQCFEMWANNVKEQVMYTDGDRNGSNTWARIRCIRWVRPTYLRGNANGFWRVRIR